MTDPFKDLHKIMEEKEGEENVIEVGCKHDNVVMEGMNTICTDCGVIMTEELSFEKEWRYYGMMDTKHSSDPNRCNMRKTDDKTIYKDVEKLGFSDKIVSCANKTYEQVTKNRIYRGNTRKGIIFACIFHAYKTNENPQSCERLIEIFEIDRKVALKGLKFVNLNAPKDCVFRSFQITTDHLIKEIMQKFHANENHIEEVLNIFHYIKGRSSLLNRSRPQSVASGLVRYYIARKNPDISMDFFRTKIRLSELTISRIVKEIGRILDSDPKAFQLLCYGQKPVIFHHTLA